MNSNNDLEEIYDISLFNISDLDVLLHETLKHARELLNAEAGTIYIKEDSYLKFHVFQNDTFSYENIYKQYYLLKNLNLPLDTTHKYLAVDAFLKKKIIKVEDIYASDKYDFLGTKEYDKKFNYITHSVITVPLIHPIECSVLGVVQLINKKIDGKVLAFDLKDKEIISMISSFIALSISKAQSDIIKLQKVNDELKKVNETLEKRIQVEVIKNYENSAVIFHQSKIASMGELLSNIAHQWRQPLSTISTIASALSLEVEINKINKDELVNQLRRIVITTKNLSETIEDFRGFYNLESAKENFSVSDAVNKSLELSQVVLSSNKISISLNINSDVKIFGLKNELTQAILNVITNIKEQLLKNVPYNEEKLIIMDLTSTTDYVILKIKENTRNPFAYKFDKEKHSEIFNMGLFMTTLIIEKHFNGNIKLENTKFFHNNKEYIGGEYTIVLSKDLC
jgi:two-component system, NtrC family, C4-dicarboxylate transport sensor histidine kinase DctB